MNRQGAKVAKRICLAAPAGLAGAGASPAHEMAGLGGAEDGMRAAGPVAS